MEPIIGSIVALALWSTLLWRVAQRVAGEREERRLVRRRLGA